jgi:hypothetical protein
MAQTKGNNKKKGYKKKKILVNALIIKVCKCGNSDGNIHPLAENASENCVTKVTKVLEAL